MLSMEQIKRLQDARRRAQDEAERVATLGKWPQRVTIDSLTARVPDVADDGTLKELGMGGFDAGVACALDLIPRDAQALPAALHAAYTPERVEQARSEAKEMHPDSGTTWWLAACSICEEGRGDAERFLTQLESFEALRNGPVKRVEAAKAQHQSMLDSFEVRDGLAVAKVDGGMQGAYLAGHDVAGMYAADYDLWFLGTFRRTLGLEEFPWKVPGVPDAIDLDTRLGRSGPVFGSTQFVKCADEDEFLQAYGKAVPQD